MFQLPYKLGQSGLFTRGPHSKNWSGLDINLGNIEWHSTVKQEICAAADGILHRKSSDFVIIDHEGDWSTGYAHICPTITNGVVKANELIGIIDTNPVNAENGWQAVSPHLHFSLYYRNSEMSIVGATFGGWTVGVESGYYDSPVLVHSTYTKCGIKKYTFQTLENIVPFSLINTSKIYFLSNVYSGLNVDIFLGSINNGTPLIQWGNHGGKNQQIKLEAKGNGRYRIRSLASNKYFSVLRNSSGVSEKLGLHESTGTLNEYWYFEKIWNDTFVIVNSRTNKAISLPGENKRWGCQLIQSEKHTSAIQQWMLQEKPLRP
jgi:hypothetical protein